MTSSSVTPISDECRFCSVVSKANGEDPIGSAWHYDQWLIIEMPQPWEDLWQQHPVLKVIFQQIQARRQATGGWIRPLVIAPDREYSQPNVTRILYYQRPPHRFAQFEPQEFLIPTDQILNLAIALLDQSAALLEFEVYRQPVGTRDLMVCTHGNVDVACARFGFPIYQQLRQEYAHENLRVWRCSHFGGHQFAPTLIDLPSGRYWGHLEADMLDNLVNHSGTVPALRRFYRGWAGLTPVEQIAEREIWMQEGWKWLDYQKSGQVLAIDASDEDYPDWAEVQISFNSPDGHITGTYTARIEAHGTVKTMWKSGKDETLEEVKQYQVRRLERTD